MDELTLKAKNDCQPLFKKGDEFIVVKINRDPLFLPIEAKHLKSGETYGFYEGELE